MALKALVPIQTTVNFLSNPWILRVISSIRRKSTNIDTIDSFTNELIEKKTLKWEVIKRARAKDYRELPVVVVPSALKRPAEIFKEFTNLRDSNLIVDIKSLNQNQIDNLVITSLDETNDKDIYSLSDQILKYKSLPSENVIFELLHYLSRKRDEIYLDKVISLCAELNYELYSENLQFRHYRALCIWTKGNSSASLETFKDIFAECNEEMKEKVKNILKILIEETIGKRSEAVLIALTNVGEFYCEQFADYEIITMIWRSCFKSLWFSDQEIARNLFEKNVSIREIIGKKANFLCYTYLRDHNLEAVHRMIELFLKFDMKAECKNVLSLLFEYQYWRKDLRACSEIIQNSVDLDIPLPDMCNQKLLSLLLGRTVYTNKKEFKAETFELKF